MGHVAHTGSYNQSQATWNFVRTRTGDLLRAQGAFDPPWMGVT